MPVEHRPVLAAEVDEQVLSAVLLDAAVRPRRAKIEDRDLRRRTAADDDRLLVHLEDGAALVLVEDEARHGGSGSEGVRSGPSLGTGRIVRKTVRNRTSNPCDFGQGRGLGTRCPSLDRGRTTRSRGAPLSSKRARASRASAGWIDPELIPWRVPSHSAGGRVA